MPVESNQWMQAFSFASACTFRIDVEITVSLSEGLKRKAEWPVSCRFQGEAVYNIQKYRYVSSDHKNGLCDKLLSYRGMKRNETYLCPAVFRVRLLVGFSSTDKSNPVGNGWYKGVLSLGY
jgi:hypothetical protein